MDDFRCHPLSRSVHLCTSWNAHSVQKTFIIDFSFRLIFCVPFSWKDIHTQTFPSKKQSRSSIDDGSMVLPPKILSWEKWEKCPFPIWCCANIYLEASKPNAQTFLALFFVAPFVIGCILREWCDHCQSENKTVHG